MGQAQRSLLMMVELVPFALTPDGLRLLGMVKEGVRTPRAPRGDFSLPTASFDLAEFEHPLAAAHGAAASLFLPGDWREGAVFYWTSTRFGSSPSARVAESVFTVAVAMIFGVGTQRRYRDLASPTLQPVWMPWDIDAEDSDPSLADYERAAHDPSTSRRIATHAVGALREEIFRHPERVGPLFRASSPAQREASLQSLYGRTAKRAEIRRVLAAALRPAARAA